MGLNLEARASSGFSGDGIDTAVINLGDCAARDADQVVVVRGLTRNIGVPTIGEVNALNQVLVGEEFEEAENGGSADAEPAPLSIGKEVGGGEVPLAPSDQGSELTPWPGKADPRLVKRLEQLSCHTATLPQLRLSIIYLPETRNQAPRASAGMIQT